MRARAASLAFAVAAAALIAGCGGSSGTELTVSAASSLSRAFPAYASNVLQETVHFNFAGSDVLATQIQQGAAPDVFASANTDYPQQLYSKGLVEKPVNFATNRLVVAVPADSSRIRSISGLAKPGVRIAIGDPNVPIGSYTREVLDRLPPDEEKAILANVASEEPDVAGIIGKLTEGAVEAGFVYASDVKAAGSTVAAIELPKSLQPDVTYAIAVVKGTGQHDAAQRFVDDLLAPNGQEILHENGFLPPP